MVTVAEGMVTEAVTMGAGEAFAALLQAGLEAAAAEEEMAATMEARREVAVKARARGVWVVRAAAESAVESWIESIHDSTAHSSAESQAESAAESAVE